MANVTTILGYDPGGNDQHGVAALSVGNSNNPIKIDIETQETVKDVIGWFSEFKDAIGIGIDTLTKWGTGRSGWRPADLWLRKTYPEVANSIAAPNSLYGSMIVNGMVVKNWFFSRFPQSVVSETHPKVLYFAMTEQRYDWVNDSANMKHFLSECLGILCEPSNDHEFDSILSCYAVLEYIRGNWSSNLHSKTDDRYGLHMEPFGNSIYAWP
jgi:hypothetical protein